MPSISINSTGTTAATTLTGSVPGTGNANLMFLNETGSAVNIAIRGSSTTMGASIVSATDATAVSAVAEADHTALGVFVSGTVPAGGYVIFNATKSDASAGNVLVNVNDISVRHKTAAGNGENVWLSVIS